jgi:hypothetical protein
MKPILVVAAVLEGNGTSFTVAGLNGWQNI